MSDTPPPTGIPDPNAPAIADTTGLAPNIAAGIATVFTIVGGIVFLVIEKKDKFVRFWAMQAVFLGGLALAVALLAQIAIVIFGLIPFVGWLLVLIVHLIHLAFTIAWFIVYLITIVKAFSRQEWEIPWLGKLARKQLAQMDGASTPPAAT